MRAKQAQLAIVLPTVGRSRSLLALLDEVRAQARPDDEICVVDQSDAPDRAALLRYEAQHRDARLAILQLDRRGLPCARNAGIAATTAPIVLFFDDDTELMPGCLDAHRGSYVDPTVGGATGRIIERRLAPNARRTVNRVTRSGRIRVNLEGNAPCAIDSLKGANMSLRRSALSQIDCGSGPFDEGYGGTSLLEEADVSARLVALGWRLRFVPAAAVVHHHAQTGGVRTGSPDALWWRFHNTARYLRRHRGSAAILPFGIAFSAIALRHAVASGEPGALPRLLGASFAGWRS